MLLDQAAWLEHYLAHLALEKRLVALTVAIVHSRANQRRGEESRAPAGSPPLRYTVSEVAWCRRPSTSQSLPR